MISLTRHFQNIADVNAFSTHVGFNVCTYAGADPAQAAADLQRLSHLTGVPPEQIHMPVQTHSTKVLTIWGGDFPIPASAIQGVDALVTDRPGQLLCINTADCLPLLLVDPEAGVIGAAHCGWRGTVDGIAARTLEAMEALGARADRVIAEVGPHICPDCFEVGEEVAAQFPEQAVIRTEGRKPHVSLLRAVQLQLPRVRFQVTLSCSMELPHYHSVRRQGRTLPLRTLTAICQMKTPHFAK